MIILLNSYKMKHEDEDTEFISLQNLETEPPETVTTLMKKLAYLRKVYLLVKTFAIVFDQIVDLMLTATLFATQEFWFAGVYLTFDLFPAAVIVWNKFQTEKSWRVLASLHLFFF